MKLESAAVPAPLPHSLFAQERQYRHFIEHANDVVFAVDPQGRLQYISPNWRDVLGSDPADFVGKDYALLLHPDDLAHCQAALSRTLTAHAKQSGIEYRIRNAAGEWRWHAANISPLQEDSGQLVGVLGIARDIHAQKEAEERQRISEERYRLLADYATDVIWTMELDGSISYLSPSIEKARGLTVEEAIKQPLHEALAPESVALVAGYFQKLHAAIQSKQPIEPFRGDMQYFRKDGSHYWGEVIATPSFDANGNFKQIVGATRDINERKQQQAELKRAHDAIAATNQALEAANAELVQHRQNLEAMVVERTRQLAAARDAAELANRAKSILLTNMSHELRTPLHHVLGYSSMLHKEVQSPKGQERLGRMRQAASGLLRLIDNLLDTARLESSQIQLIGVDFDLGVLLDRVDASLHHLFANKGLDLQREVSEGTHLRLHGDADRIAQVLTELLDNAAKFSNRGPIIVRVTQALSSGTFLNLRVEVQDHGIGIPLDVQANMFQLFIQGDGSATRKYSGTGMGLALCQRLVNLMGGDIGFESAPDKGSLFWFEVPLAQVQRTASQQPVERLTLQQARPQLENLLMLLSEGDLSAQELWSTCAPQMGHLLGDSLSAFGSALGNYEFVVAMQMLEHRMASPN